MQETPHHPTTRLAELDALRGIAAMLVVLFHYTWQGVHVLPELKLIPWGLFWGSHGVSLFFAISGFVIFMTLDRTKTAMDFVVSRFARLFPAYWIAITLTTAGLALLQQQPLIQPTKIILINFSMLQSYFYLPSVDKAYWSLAVELGFYLCMLALWHLNLLNRIERVLIIWIALKLVWWGMPELPTRLREVLILRYIPWFAIGIVAYRVRTGLRSWPQQIPVLLAAFAALGIADGPSEMAVFAAVTATFLAMNAGHLQFLNTRILLWLGGISYPLYLVHQNLGYAIISALERAGTSAWIALLCAIAAALLMAHIIHTLLEQPALTLIRNWWKNRAKRQTV